MPICKGITKKGINCKNNTLNDYCHCHFQQQVKQNQTEKDPIPIECFMCYRTTRNTTDVSCGHTFHSRCLKKWLKHSQECPLCRKCISNKEPTEMLYDPNEHNELPPLEDLGIGMDEFPEMDHVFDQLLQYLAHVQTHSQVNAPVPVQTLQTFLDDMSGPGVFTVELRNLF